VKRSSISFSGIQVTKRGKLLFFFYTKIEQKLKNVFFSKSTIFAAFSSKNFVFCVWFSLKFPLIFSLRFICLRKQRWGIYMTHSPKREKWCFRRISWVFIGPKIFFGPQFQYLSLETAFFVAETDFHFIFLTKKHCFHRISWVFLVPPKNIFWTAVSVFVPWKTAFFRTQNQLSFYFFWNKKFICRKKCCFRRISWVFIVFQIFFW